MNEIAVRGRPFPPGISGNPNGRPVGSRQKFSQAFADDFLTVWNESGIEAVRKLAHTNFEAFVAIGARILPKDFALTVEQALPRALDESDLAILRAIKLGIADAGQRSPDAILSFTLDAIRSHSAKLIDATSEAETEGQNS